MTRYFYKETGMYIDWEQIKNLPDIDTFIDVGVGPSGTPNLYKKFAKKKLVLIDPLTEAEEFYKKEMQENDAIFFRTALGEEVGSIKINVEENIGRSTILDVSDINFEGSPIDNRIIPVDKLDNVLANANYGNIGIKIDTEGYELNVIKGAKNTLKNTKFVIAEVRHNHESFKGVYKLHEFISEMHDNGFVISMILSAKPFIADLCFQPISDLDTGT